MNASKENAEEALQKFAYVLDYMNQEERAHLGRMLSFIENFLKAAKKKLPYEKSFPKKAASRP